MRQGCTPSGASLIKQATYTRSRCLRSGRLPSCRKGTPGDAGEGSERGADDVPTHRNAKSRPAVRQPGFDIGRRLRIGSRPERVLVIVEHGDIGDAGAPECIDERVERAAAMAFDDALVAAIHDRRIDRAPFRIGQGAVFDEVDLALTEISLTKHGP